MNKYTLTTAAVLALLSGTAQAEKTDFNGLTISGSFVGQGIDYVDGDFDPDETIHSDGFGAQLDYSINRIVGITAGYTNTSSDSEFLTDRQVELDTERFFTGVNLGYRFEGDDWAVKPFGVLGFNAIRLSASGTVQGVEATEDKTFNKPYAGGGVALSYQQLTATFETDVSELEHDVIFVESRLTLGYRF